MLQSRLAPIMTTSAGVAQLVEHHLAKVRVAGSSPVARSVKPPDNRGFFFG
jgi:hypothetical protein